MAKLFLCESFTLSKTIHTYKYNLHIYVPKTSIITIKSVFNFSEKQYRTDFRAGIRTIEEYFSTSYIKIEIFHFIFKSSP